MKIRISITLSRELLETVDQLSQQYKSRSAFIESALSSFTAQLIRQERDQRDLEIINQYADELNREAEDVLGYQTAC